MAHNKNVTAGEFMIKMHKSQFIPDTEYKMLKMLNAEEANQIKLNQSNVEMNVP